MRKMKKLTAKNFFFFLLILIFVLIFSIIKLREPKGMLNSFKNTGYFGNALYMDTLKGLDYSVKYNLMPIENLDTQALIVLNTINRNYELTEQDYEKIIQYVKDGGNLLVLNDGNNQLFEDLLAKHAANYEGYQHEIIEYWLFDSEGILMAGDANDFSNMAMLEDREDTYKTLQVLHPFIVENGVVFNEYYLYMMSGKRSLWGETPEGVKFIIYQVILAGFLFIWYKGKRFGAPAVLYEEVEPEEHQYAIAVGELYYQGGHYEVILEAYYRQLLQKIHRKSLLELEIKDERLAENVEKWMDEYHQGFLNGYPKKVRNAKIKVMIVNIQNLMNRLE